MRRDGAGQRWKSVELASIRKHDPNHLRTGTVPLEQTFVRSGEKPFTVKLTFLSSRPVLARVLANVFWVVHQNHLRKLSVTTRAHCLRLFIRFLDDRMKGQPDITSASQLSADVLKEMAVWLIVERRLQRKTAAHSLNMCCWLLRQAKRLYPADFDPAFSTPANLFPGGENDRPPSKAMSPEIFQQVLTAASKDLDEIRQAYVPGETPTSAQQIIPFMILIGARTGINPDALYRLGRDCLVPHEIDEGCFYLVWDKPRAGKLQRQLHRVDRRQQSGVVELIQFMREYTEPLARQASPPANTKLFLYRSTNTLLRNRLISSCTAPRLPSRRLKEFWQRHNLPPFSLSQIRPSAATLLYLRTAGNLGKVRQFLQHAHFSTTIRYVLNHVTEQFNTRVIQQAQSRMVERVTVIPEERAVGIEHLDLPRPQVRKIVHGRYDTGCGSCRDPYDSPQANEVKGRPCTSFHACFSCPNALWFLDDLPLVIATRDRFLRLRSEMNPNDWNAVYGDNVRIINEEIIAAFRPEQVDAAAARARELGERPLIITQGVLG
jgi:integrase